MSLTLINTGDTVYGATLNSVINVLQRSAGQTETGKYKIEHNLYTNSGIFISTYIFTLSRNATPVSVSIDTADDSPFDLNSPSTGHLSQGGFQVFAGGNTTSSIGHCAGNWSVQY